MEARDNEDVEDARFLEGDGFVAIDEGAVAEEHGAESGCRLRIVGEESVDFVAEVGAKLGDAVRDSL